MAYRILFLDANMLSAWRPSGGRIEDDGDFPPDADGLARFAEYLAKHRGSVYLMLADVADEGYRFEEMPWLRGRDRIALIRHKLARHYPATALTVGLTLGRGTAGRRDERMLFAALTRPQQFEPWLKALKTGQAALAGIFSLPQLVKTLPGCGADSFLLVALTRAGLRQTFVENGEMRFSRLTPLASDAEAARTCAREAANMHHYLDGQRLIGSAAALTVRVLLHPAQNASFREHCRDSAELRYEYLDLCASAARCGFKTPLPDSRAERLFAHLLVRHRPRAQFAHADDRRIFRLGQMRFGIGLATAGVLLACLGFAGLQAVEFRRLDAATAALRTQNEDSRHRYRAALATMPPLPLAAERFAALTERYAQLRQRSPGPLPMFRHIASALDGSPEVELVRLDWSVAAREHGENGSPASGAHVVVELEATLPTTIGTDPQRQSDAVERFAARLRREPGVEVRVLSRPADVESAKAHVGTGEAPAPPLPRFALRAAQSLETP